MRNRFSLILCCLFFGSLVHAAEYYVAPNGSDDQPGTESAPFASLEKARDTIRQARRDGTIKQGEAVTVLLEPGDYFLNKSFELTAEDSGSDTGPVQFRSKIPNTARLIGGFVVPTSAFKKIVDDRMLARIDSKSKNKILVADLNSLNIPGMEQWRDNFRGRPDMPPELFFNEQPMTVARWPNSDWFGFKTTLDSGRVHDDKTEEDNRKAAEKAGVRFVHPDADTTKPHGGTIVYDEESLKNREPNRFERWNVEEGVWLFGYWVHDWAEEALRVAAINTKDKTLATRAPHYYGIGGNTWSDFSERRYFALNLLEELDAPGEWYLDRKANSLYFYPPKKFGKDDSIILSTLSPELIRLDNTQFVRILELSLGPTFGGAIRIKGGERNEIAGCRIFNTGAHGILVEGGKEHSVRSCDLFNIGSCGVSLSGGDRKNLTPSGHVAENNHIHHFGRWNRTYSGAFNLHGVGNTVRNNRIHDAPHLAIAYGGNEHRIQRNEIYNVALETSDAGALYSGRDWTTQGNVIEENFIHHIGPPTSHSTMGVYLDDCDSGDTVRRNVFYKACNAVFIGGGRDNTVVDNLFIECYRGISLDARGMTWKQWNQAGDGWNLEEKAENLNYKNPPWSERYPKLAATMQNEPKAPLGCVFARNIMIDCKKWMNLDGNVLKLLERSDLKDNIVVEKNLVVENSVKSEELKLPEKERKLQKGVRNVDPGFVNLDKLDFRFKPNSPLKKILSKDFEPIPFEKIGIRTDEYRKTIKKQSFSK